MSLVVNDEWCVPRFVFDGERVVAPYTHEGKRGGLWCVVACAAGNHARVVNEKYNVDRWFDIDDLRIPVPAGEQALKRLRDPI
jgi:hypothetical protein